MSELDDLQIALVVAQAGESVPRWRIGLYAPHLRSALEVVEAILARRPDLKAGAEAQLAFATRVRDHGVPAPRAETPVSDVRISLERQIERTRSFEALAVEVAECHRVLGAIAWRYHREVGATPGEPWYRAFKVLLRRQRKQREEDRHLYLGKLDEKIAALRAANGSPAELGELTATRARIARLDITELCVDLTLP